MRLGIALIDFHFDVIERVLRQIFYGKPVSAEDETQFGQAIYHWNRKACRQRGCPHRADTCRFAGPDLEWVKELGYVSLCELLHKKRPPRAVSALDATWLRRPGHYNG